MDVDEWCRQQTFHTDVVTHSLYMHYASERPYGNEFA